MVQRKSSLPYPSSPPPAPPEPSTQANHHNIYANDVPPVLQSARTERQMTSNFEDMGNPWEDNFSPHPSSQKQQSNNSSLPDPLKVGTGNTSGVSAPNRSNTNLQTLPEALRPGRSGEATPRSSIDSDRSPDREWWDDDPFEEIKDKGKQPERDGAQGPGELHVVNDTPSAPLPSPGIKRKPVAHSPVQPQSRSPSAQPIQQQNTGAAFSSNNPFRRPSETFLHAPTDLPDWGSESRERQSPSQPQSHPHPLRSSPSTDALGKLNLNDSAIEQHDLPPPAAPASAPPPVPAAGPPPPPPSMPRLEEPLLPWPSQQENVNPWEASQPKISPTPSPLPFNPSQQHITVSSDNLLDRGRYDGAIGLADELKVLDNAAPSPLPAQKSGTTEVSLLDDDEPGGASVHPQKQIPAQAESEELYAPPPGPPPSHSVQPPMKPPRPAVVTSEADLAKMKEQRNETYQIKHFDWYDLAASRTRRSSMLVQNQNGPCPLLALVNALILGAGADAQASLDDALSHREQVSLGLIIETLMDELLTKAMTVPSLQLPEIDELNKFLMRLRTGMNANPRFVPPKESAPNLMDEESPIHPRQTPAHIAGTFEGTQDIKLYNSFAVKLMHGWLPRPGDQAAQAFLRSAQSYEDAQAVQFGEEELEYKLSHGGLSQQEQHVWEDITSIKQFFTAYPTQLTPYGLGAIKDALRPGEFAILFRNDHFSTIYKHPQHQALYTLVTDAGFADRDEIIWESLEDINGARTSYFSGDFQSVSHGDSYHPMPHSMTDAANPRRASTRSYLTANEQPDTSAMTPQAQQEQHDADFAMALQLQEEEEQRMRQQGRAGGSGVQPSPPTRPRRSQGNIPIPLRGNTEQRPVIPPRNQPRNPAVNRPADANAADAPPMYEEAVRTAAYNPPIGSPLHPSSTNDLPSTGTSYINATGQSTGTTSQARLGQRRTSAYNQNASSWGNSPGYSAGVYGSSQAFQSPGGQQRVDPSGRDRDCVVM